MLLTLIHPYNEQQVHFRAWQFFKNNTVGRSGQCQGSEPPALDPVRMKRMSPKPRDQSSMTLTLCQLVPREGGESAKWGKCTFAGNYITLVLMLGQFSPEPRMR